MTLLARNLRISADDIAQILKKYGVCAEEDELQHAYRRRVGQRLMASIRDEEGRRELLAFRRENGGTEYVVIGCCNDPRKLKSIRNRLLGSMAGLDVSARKVRARLGFLERFLSSVSPRLRKRKE